MNVPIEILTQLLKLEPAQKVELIEMLLASLDVPDEGIEASWAKEVEGRIEAYDLGKIKSITLEEILEKYK